MTGRLKKGSLNTDRRLPCGGSTAGHRFCGDYGGSDNILGSK